MPARLHLRRIGRDSTASREFAAIYTIFGLTGVAPAGSCLQLSNSNREHRMAMPGTTRPGSHPEGYTVGRTPLCDGKPSLCRSHFSEPLPRSGKLRIDRSSASRMSATVCIPDLWRALAIRVGRSTLVVKVSSGSSGLACRSALLLNRARVLLQTSLLQSWVTTTGFSAGYRSTPLSIRLYTILRLSLVYTTASSLHL